MGRYVEEREKKGEERREAVDGRCDRDEKEEKEKKEKDKGGGNEEHSCTYVCMGSFVYICTMCICGVGWMYACIEGEVNVWIAEGRFVHMRADGGEGVVG